MSLIRVEPLGQGECRVRADGTLLAAIRDLRLTALRLQTDGPLLIGPEVPLPLYWQQYADHEHPERNASSGGTLSIERPAGTDSPFSIVCRGTNGSGGIRSTYRLSFTEPRPGMFELSVHALLEVTGGQGWLITPNPHHGELEFCNAWPVGTFSSVAGQRKLYTHTAVRRGGKVTLVRHTHLESADKHRIMLQRGDRVAWLLEEQNPVITLESDLPASAGLCAYMWDLHVGYPVCEENVPCVLPPGFSREARFRLSSMPRGEGKDWLDRGTAAESPEDHRWPVVVQGVNTFRTTFENASGEIHAHWPWSFEAVEGLPGAVRGELDQSAGYDDSASLCIRSSAGGAGRWMATTLGPAFGGAAFSAGRRYRLSARVRTAGLEGEARIALRVHRSGERDLYHPERYELYLSAAAASGTTEWEEQAVLTPPVAPAPDRVHILLLHRGRGTSWFDNVLFEESE